MAFAETRDIDPAFLEEVNRRLAGYMPEGGPAHAGEVALYEPESMYGTSAEQAKQYRLDAVCHAFRHHYENNRFYHDYCREHDVAPDDITGFDDFRKIPLLSHRFFKDYPSGKEFAMWVANIMTGEIPQVTIDSADPSYDDVIESFGRSGVTIAYSSGTTGRFTFIPRDQQTYYNAEYAIARCCLEMLSDWWEYDSDAYLLFPHPHKTNLWVGKVTAALPDAVVKNVEVAIDREITTDLIRISMGRPQGLKEKLMSGVARLTAKRRNQKMVDDIISWLKRLEDTGRHIGFFGAPFILNLVMNKMEREGMRFDFGERGAVITGGGWKVHEDKRLPVDAFRGKVEKYLGIPDRQCLDLYAMVESNAFMIQCPEGHYLHIPHNYFHPMVLDENNQPLGYGETGKFAFLDGLAMSYPGFIFTGDRVKLLERCPVCGREGPVLEPEVSRMAGEEIRGCAEEMRKMLLSDLDEVS
ncbi:MAG: hypothetical protein R6U10_07025 [Thermoplasmatota archaeon]